MMKESDWLRAFWIINEESDFSKTYDFPRIMKNIVMPHF